MRYTRYTGLAQVTNWVRLKFAAMNLKKFAIRKWEDTHILLQILIFCPKSIRNPSLHDAKLGFLDGLKHHPFGWCFLLLSAFGTVDSNPSGCSMPVAYCSLPTGRQRLLYFRLRRKCKSNPPSSTNSEHESVRDFYLFWGKYPYLLSL